MSDVPTGLALWIAAARRAAPVWLLALAIVGIAELGARQVLGDDETWRYWNRTMASKVRYLKKQTDRGKTFDRYVVGDSSAAFNIMPNELDEVLGEGKTFNLGSAGNYARSFEVVMLGDVLPRLPDPDLMIASFAGRGFLPESRGQTERVLASPVGQQRLGNRVWGEWIWLVRVHHLLRLYRDPPVAPTVFRNRGFEPYLTAIKRRARRPRLAKQLPQPPEWMVRPGLQPPVEEEDPFAPLHALRDYTRERGIQLVLVSPPNEDERVLVDELAALAASWGVPHFDYTDLPLESHNSHLDVRGARLYSRKIAEDITPLVPRGD